ncbi:MAG: flagellar hook-length control protein FliK [Rhodobacterales bacterium]|nr:flagellar hook-length control protein FliK [Rhodobacterales bacterium]
MCSAITNPTGLKTTNLLGAEQSASVANRVDIFGELFNIMSSLDGGQGDLNGLMDGAELDKAKIQLASSLNAGNISEVESMLTVLTANSTDGRLTTSDPDKPAFNGEFSSFELIAGKLLHDDAKLNLTHEVSEDIATQNEISAIKDAVSQVLALIGSLNFSDKVRTAAENAIGENSKIPYFDGLSNELGLSDLTAFMRQKPDFVGGKVSEEIKIDLALFADVNNQDSDPSKLFKIYSGGENSEVVESLNVEIIDENTLKVAVPEAITLKFQTNNNETASATNSASPPIEDDANVIVTFKADETVKVTRHTGELVDKSTLPDHSEEIGEFKELSLPVVQKFKNIIEYRTSIQNVINGLSKLKAQISNKTPSIEFGSKIDNAINALKKKGVAASTSKSTKASMFISTADILSLRALPSKINLPIALNSQLQGLGERGLEFGAEQALKNTQDPSRAQSTLNSSVSRDMLGAETFSANLNSNGMKNPVLVPMQSTPGFANQLSLLDAQFTSRLAAIAVEQAVNNGESLELFLEPKSFGKLQVNASLETNGLDVKLVAENSATLAILRGSEALLGNITEQHGLKLSNYSVDMSNGQNHGNGNEQGQKNHEANDHINRNNGDDTSNMIEKSTDTDNNLLNLIA